VILLNARTMIDRIDRSEPKGGHENRFRIHIAMHCMASREAARHDSKSLPESGSESIDCAIYVGMLQTFVAARS